LVAASNSQILFELLLHGGEAGLLVEWMQKYPAESFRDIASVDGIGESYGAYND
jgi:hypothetical protein